MRFRNPNLNFKRFSPHAFCASLSLAAAVLTLLASFFLPSASARTVSQEDTVAARDVDFQSDIFPILQTHCLECHNDAKADGDLRLNSKESALMGGHTGNSILGPPAEASELLLRINSSEDGYRMPKKGAPLSPEQIKTLTLWINQGAYWPTESSDKTQPQSTNPLGGNVTRKSKKSLSTTDWLAQQYLLLEKPQWRYPFVVIATGGSILFLICLNRFLRKRRNRRNESSPPNREQNETKWLLTSLALLTALITVIAYQRGKIETLMANGGTGSLSSRPKTVFDSSGRATLSEPPKVFKPLHPPRLGGTYYRGNDERSEELFNNGFYRTAELQIKLIDRAGEKVEFGDEVEPNGLSIRFEMRRAKGATRALFAPRTLSTAYLSTFFDRRLTEKDRKLLQPVEPGEKWETIFPVDFNQQENDDQQSLSGTIYVFYGPLEHNRIHYAINYSLNIKDGIVQPKSEIWMGSAYNLSGRVVVPSENQIGLQHWFDFRPIPEIEGKNSEKPELLGLPEHLGTNSDSTPLGQN